VALSFNGIDGDYVEFGCHGGLTFDLAYQESRRVGHPCVLWGFDSFSGLPAQQTSEDEHPQWMPGTMHTSLDDFHSICKYNGIPLSAYRIVPGFYKETLADDSSSSLPSDICLAYVDCDLYSSTVSVMRFLRTRIKHGMIIALDDYYCWSSAQISGEKKALNELFAGDLDWRLEPYVQYNWSGMSFVVESKKV
jgi:hypothetical protein